MSFLSVQRREVVTRWLLRVDKVSRNIHYEMRTRVPSNAGLDYSGRNRHARTAPWAQVLRP